MNKLNVAQAILIVFLFFFTSCSKNGSINLEQKDVAADNIVQVSKYKKFIDSLDWLSPQQRILAVKASQPSSRVSVESIGKNTVLEDVDDETYWQQLTSYLSVDNMGFQINESLIEEGDWYYGLNGIYYFQTGPSKKASWTLAFNPFGLWELISREQFVAENFIGWRFTGIKHINSLVTGITTFITWNEVSVNQELSAERFAAYSNVEGNLTFSFKIFSSVVLLDRVQYFAVNEMF